MPDDNDGYLEIDLDEEDGQPAGETVLELDLDEPASTASAPVVRRPRRPASPAPPPPPVPPSPSESAGLPMTAGGVCPRCGFALRPLEETCPRCHLSLDQPAEKPVTDKSPSPPILADTETALPPAEPPTAARRGGSLLTIAGIIFFLALVVGLPLYLWTQPTQRAKREYQAGLRAQLAGDFELARQHYVAALQLDPQMGLAAFSAGTTYLRIGDPALVQSIDKLTQAAIWGQTQELDEADRWFRQAAAIGQNLPPSERLMDQRINTPPRLRAFARACLALTALIRGSAAIQADQLDDGMAWFGVATQQAQAAAADDPGNEAAQQVLRAVPPVVPGRNSSS
jgi:tetratricopeptide (TPR) repeat protein